MKTYIEFIAESDFVPPKKLGMVDPANITHFGKRKRKKTFTSKEKSVKLTSQQTKEMEDVIVELDKIASGYGAKFDKTAVRGHLKDRIHQRGFQMSDLVDIFKNIEKKTNFFDTLKKLDKIGLIGWKSKLYGPQILCTKKKIQFGTRLTNGGKNIVVKTVLKNWKPRDQQDMKQVGIKHFYAA